MTKKDTIAIICDPAEFDNQLLKDLEDLEAKDHKLITVIPILTEQRPEPRTGCLETEITLCAHYIEVTY